MLFGRSSQKVQKLFLSLGLKLKTLLATCFLLVSGFDPEGGGSTILRNIKFTRLHGVRSPRAVFFSVTAVNNLNPPKICLVYDSGKMAIIL
jgi:hypothetical protein